MLAVSGTALVAHALTGPDGPPRPPSGTTATAPARPGPGSAATAGTSSSTPVTGTPSSTATASTPAPDTFGPVLPGATPVSLDVPAIKVHENHLVHLGYDKQGGLEVPKSFGDAGWFSPGPSPGQLGPAVIAGHVDSKAGPAVFYRLGDLRHGDAIAVGRDDGTTAHFVVDHVEEYPKDRFPTSDVYGNTTNRAELRLITCGGDFNHGTGHYLDNIVVFAHLVDG